MYHVPVNLLPHPRVSIGTSNGRVVRSHLQVSNVDTV